MREERHDADHHDDADREAPVVADDEVVPELREPTDPLHGVTSPDVIARAPIERSTNATSASDTPTTNAMTSEERCVTGGPVDARTLGRPEDAERREHHADAELHRVLGHPREGLVDDHRGDEHYNQRSRGADRRQADVALRAAKGHDDERHFEAFEEDPLERDRERVPVVAGFGSSGLELGHLGPIDRILVVQSLQAAGSEDRLAQPLEPEEQEQRADDESQRVDRELRERRAEHGDDDRQGTERGSDAPPGRPPSPSDADGEHDRHGLDHLDRAREERRDDDEQVVHLASG